MRISEEEFAALTGSAGPAVKKKKNKYHAKKALCDGIYFDSTLEADYYLSLKMLTKAGLIAGYVRQARFVIIEGAGPGTASEYVCDFIVFNNDGTYKIVDTKGIKTEVFKLKMKALKEKYPKLTVHCEGETDGI